MPLSAVVIDAPGCTVTSPAFGAFVGVEPWNGRDGIRVLIKPGERRICSAGRWTRVPHRSAEGVPGVVDIRHVGEITFVERCIRNVERRRIQGIDVDLRAASENDPVLVDQVNLSVRLDRTQDLTGYTCRVENPIQCDPVVGPVLGSRALIEIDGGVLADVEGLPGQDCLGRGLRDVDRSLAVGGDWVGRLAFCHRAELVVAP